MSAPSAAQTAAADSPRAVSPVTPRVERLWQRAWEGIAPRSVERSAWAQEVLKSVALEAAMREPEHYRHLTVRVAGYSDYFTRQGPEGQAYILAREKYGEV